MEKTYRLFDFNVYNEKIEKKDDIDEETTYYKDNKVFMIQMFGINEKGETCSIFVEDFKPFFYVKVADSWSNSTKLSFLANIKKSHGAIL